MLDAKIASALNKIIQNSPLQEEGQSRGTESPVRGSVSTRKTDRFHDYFRVTGAHDTVLDYADLFSVTLHDDNIQEFDTRWYEVLLSMSKIPSDDILESLFKLRIRESRATQNRIGIVRHGDSSEFVDAIYQKLKTMVKRSTYQKTSITKLRRQTREN